MRRMKMRAVTDLLRWPMILLALAGGLALPLRASAQSAARFFPAKDLMRVGVYYYPEHWPEGQWERDFARMEELGFEFVHMGELDRKSTRLNSSHLVISYA